MPNRSKDADGAGAGGEAEPTYPLMTNRPGVEVVNPVGRVRLAALLFAAAIVLASAAAAYIATAIGADRVEKSNAALLADMNRRTAARLENESNLRIALEQYRRDMCTVLGDHPETPKNREVLNRYRCHLPYEPVVPPGWQPPKKPAFIEPTPSAPTAPSPQRSIGG